VVVGGVVTDADERKLKKASVREIFHPGARARKSCARWPLAHEARAAKNKELLA
jgi:methylmalonyl-CoA mutase cobalamin-binding subunit